MQRGEGMQAEGSEGSEPIGTRVLEIEACNSEKMEAFETPVGENGKTAMHLKLGRAQLVISSMAGKRGTTHIYIYIYMVEKVL